MSENIDLNWLVSVDDHVIEPPHVWQDRVPAKHKERAPRIVRDDSGEYWLYEDKKIPTPGLSAAAGKRREEFSLSALTYEDMRPGCYDPVERIKDMNRAGVLASLCFPSFPRFCGQAFSEANDRELALVCVRAYNDWMIEEWCGSAPGRYIPLIILPLWDPSLGAMEIERCAAKGPRGVAFSENPAKIGLPSIHDRERYWDPVFAAAQEAAMVVCMHMGSSSSPPVTAADAPGLVLHAIFPSVAGSAMADWIFSGVFNRFPNLKIALSEGDIGWMPYYLQRCEQALEKHRAWATRSLDWSSESSQTQLSGSAVDFDDLDVRRVFREHVHGCFIDDMHGVRSLDEIGIDNVMVETDYPHSDTTWPNSIDVARKQLAGLNDNDAYKILRGNAERLFRFTPAEPPSTSR